MLGIMVKVEATQIMKIDKEIVEKESGTKDPFDIL